MRILVAVIAYNEEKNLGNVFDDLISNNFGYDILLVDNASSDESIKLAEDYGINYMQHCVNSGAASGTVRAYFMYAQRHNYDILVQFDGDGQHNASFIKELVTPIEKGDADYVIGSRFLEEGGFKSYAIRRIGIRIMSSLARFITGFAFTDITSGARAYSSKVIKFMSQKYHFQFYDTLQLALISYYAGAKFKELPVRMNERIFGQSEYNLGTSITYMVKSFVNFVGFIIRFRGGMNRGPQD